MGVTTHFRLGFTLDPDIYPFSFSDGEDPKVRVLFIWCIGLPIRTENCQQNLMVLANHEEDLSLIWSIQSIDFTLSSSKDLHLPDRDPIEPLEAF